MLGSLKSISQRRILIPSSFPQDVRLWPRSNPIAHVTTKATLVKTSYIGPVLLLVIRSGYLSNLVPGVKLLFLVTLKRVMVPPFGDTRNFSVNLAGGFQIRIWLGPRFFSGSREKPRVIWGISHFWCPTNLLGCVEFPAEKTRGVPGHFAQRG